MRPRHLLPLILTVLVGPAMPGCLHAGAKMLSDSPPLDMPVAPPRVVDIVEFIPPEPLELVQEPAHEPIAPPVARPQPRAEVAPRPPEAPKIEIQSQEPPAAETPPKPPPTFLTIPAGTEAEVRRIGDKLAKANADLRHVDYRTLNADAVAQYETAKRFIQQAEEALRTPLNLVLARNLADKAAALAAQLAGR